MLQGLAMSTRNRLGYHEQVKASYAEVARAIARFEPVTMLTLPSLGREVKKFLGPEVEVLRMDMDDSWIRDNGPFFVKSPSGDLAIVHFGFNGWGERFKPYERDARVPELLAKRLGVRLYRAPMILEGGSICVDGEGTLLTTESCLLNPNRNHDLTREEIESILRSYLGIRKVLWLREGLYESQVDGHIDGIAAFVRPKTLVVAMTREPSDSNHPILKENRERLETMTDAKGRSFEIIELSLPTRRKLGRNRIAATYVNFYIANGGVAVPVFGDPADKAALGTLRDAFSDREVVGVRSEFIGLGGGFIHCITQQRPSAQPS